MNQRFSPDDTAPEASEDRRARLIDRLLDHSARDNRALQLAIRLIEAEMLQQEQPAPRPPATPASAGRKAALQDRPFGSHLNRRD